MSYLAYYNCFQTIQKLRLSMTDMALDVLGDNEVQNNKIQ